MTRMCEDCGVFFDRPEFIVTDLHNYQAKLKRLYKRLDHFKEVLGQSQGREGKDIPAEVLHRIRCELPIFREVTTEDVKSAMRKLKLPKYMENLYYIQFAVTGRKPPYVRREVEDKMIRAFKQIDQIY